MSSSMMRRIKVELLEPGDIVLTSAPGKISRGIRAVTKGEVSHAMICVTNGSIIDSTDYGVQAHNIQRELYGDGDTVSVYRLRQPVSDVRLNAIIDLARSEIGTQYSKAEAIRTVLGGPKPRSRKQFCSRLVARAFAAGGVQLVGDPDYCSPEELRRSPLLVELDGMTEWVTEEELRAWAARPNPIADMQAAQNAVLDVARKLDPSIENFNDLDRYVQEHPEADAEIARAYRETGYLQLWRTDYAVNPWHYDLEAMDAIVDDRTIDDMRAYCVSTIKEAYTAGIRYAVNLVHYRAQFAANKRETTAQLVMLYEQLVRSDQQRRDTAGAWLERHFPEDARKHRQRIVPHSELWFSIIDRVEPNLGAIARMSIRVMGSEDVCSFCGDPPADYRLINSADAIPGVPSLRLCSDCVEIRRGGGEVLEPLSG